MSSSMSPSLLLATHNRKKLAELSRILAPLVPGIEVLCLDDLSARRLTPYDEPSETEPTFCGNARLKARTAVAHTGIPSVADDSGLCVDALNGMPGVLSARWAGRPTDDRRNVALLLDQLSDVPDEQRDVRDLHGAGPPRRHRARGRGSAAGPDQSRSTGIRRIRLRPRLRTGGGDPDAR